MNHKYNVFRLGIIWLISFFLIACGGEKESDDNSLSKLTVTQVPNFEVVAGDQIEHQLEISGPEIDEVTFSVKEGPSDLTVGSTGIIKYTSNAREETAQNIVIQVQDQREGSKQVANVRFTLTEKRLFELMSTAGTEGNEAQQYQYQVDVKNNAPQSQLAYNLVNAPQGMSISSKGLIAWTPERGVFSSGEVTLEIEGSNNNFSDKVTEDFTVTVEPIFLPIEVESISAQSIESGNRFLHTLVVDNPNEDIGFTELQYTLQEGPEGLTLSQDGIISFDSNAAQTTKDTVKLQVALKDTSKADPTSVSFELTQAVYVYTSGQVVNFYTNTPVADASVIFSVDGSQIYQTTASATGDFVVRVQDIEVGDRYVLTADHSGYSENSLSLLTEEFDVLHQLRLAPVHNVVAFDNQTEQELQVEEQTLVVLPSTSLVDAQGNVVSNAVAELTIIDPTLNIDLMPGDMVTPSEDEGDLVPIESFGAITVTFEDQEGNPLNLSEDAQAEIRIPVAGNNPPSTIPLYYYDTIAGVWVEEGEAVKVSDSSGDYYRGFVSHFTTWNADIIIDTVQLSGCVVDADGEPVRRARIQAQGQTYNGQSSAYSDDQGNFTLSVRRDSTLLLSALSNYQSRTLQVTTTGQDKVLTDCLELGDAFTSIKLTWGASPSDLDSHFTGPYNEDNSRRFEIYYSNKTVEVNGIKMFLDVDDTSGYGPEIISVPEFPLPGVYSYFVNRFSGGTINPSETRVELNIDGRVTTFTPPQDNISKYWYVFDLVVDENLNPTIEVVQEYSSSKPATPRYQQPNPAARGSFEQEKSIPQRLIEEKYYAVD
ncbi:carboxypeptidase regulatory-like domain-containing protein [Vibrio sp. WXL103]|uniref:carboxypeptidase regulatory-like domain-containing protein n=1 Tax=Vibrio sp. WXL103 TaxID=3450710 RepID=UPI003EC57220